MVADCHLLKSGKLVRASRKRKSKKEQNNNGG